MGLLNILFGSMESTVKEIYEDDEDIIKHWKNYHDILLPKRKDIIEKVTLENISQDSISELKKLSNSELVDVSTEEKKESELIDDLDEIEKYKKIKRVDKLEKYLDYAGTKYEDIYTLLGQLHSTITSQIKLLGELNSQIKDNEKLLSFKSQFELELEIVNKIDRIESFHNLFLALIKGENIIKTMDRTEKLLLEKIRNGVSKIFSNEITERITNEWALNVFSSVQDIVMGNETIIAEGYNPRSDIDFEFVNGLDFVNLVKTNIPHLEEIHVSEQIIDVFVQLFREWYNHERN